MAVLSYPTAAEISGPLLIDADQLTALDQIIDQYFDKLKEDLEQDINARAASELSAEDRGSEDEERVRERLDRTKSRLRQLYGTENRSVAVYLQGGKTITSDRFADAITQPHVGNELALGFRSDLRVGKISASVSLRSKSLDVRVEPRDSAVAQELYGAMENWVSDFAPPLWQRLWLKLVDPAEFVLFMLVLSGLFLMFVPIQREAKELYRSEAQQILNQGVNPANQSLAIGLVLAIVSDYNPKGEGFGLGIKGWGYYVACILILCAFRTCPSVVIGIWKV